MNAIFENSGWPLMQWDVDVLAPLLAEARYNQGLLWGKMSALTPKARAEAQQLILQEDMKAYAALSGIKAESLFNLTDESALEQAGVIKAAKKASSKVKAAQTKNSRLKSGKVSLAKTKTTTGYAVVVNTHAGSSPGANALAALQTNLYKQSDELLTAARLYSWHNLMWDAAGMLPANVSLTPANTHLVSNSSSHSGASGLFEKLRSGNGELAPDGFWREVAPMAMPSASLADEMKLFFAWFNFGNLPVRGGMQLLRREKTSLLWQDSLIKAGITCFWLNILQPFTCLNASVIAAVTDMALLRSDAGSKRYYSFWGAVKADRMGYTNALNEASQGNMDISAWLCWFLKSVLGRLQHAEKQLALVLRKNDFMEQVEKAGLNPRQKVIIQMMLNDALEQVTSSSYADLVKTSPDSALRDMQGLIKAGVLRKNSGGGRSTSYSLKL